MKKSVLVVLLAMFAMPAYSEIAPATKEVVKKNQLLIEALSRAYQTNPDVHVGLRQYYAAVEALPLAKSGWFPTLTVTGQGTHEKVLNNNGTASNAITNKSRILSNKSSDTMSITTALEQNIFNGFGTTHAINQAHSSIKAAKMAFLDVEQKVLLDSLKAYLNLWKSYKTLHYRTSSVGFNKRLVAQIKAQESVGEKTRTDVAEAKSRLAGTVAERLTAESAVATARAAYEQVIGGPIPESLDMPSLTLFKNPLPSTMKSLRKRTLLNSPRLQQAILSEKSQKAAIGVAESSLLPTVGLSASASRTKTNTQTNKSLHDSPTTKSRSFDYTNTGTMGVKVTVPLFSGGGKWSGIRKANQQRYQALSTVRKIRLEVDKDAASIWQTVQSLKGALKQLKLQVKAAKVSLEGKRQEYLVGELTLTDTLTAEENLVKAQVQLVATQRDYQVNMYQLVSIYGALFPEMLGLPVERHDVAVYTNEMSNKFFGTGNLREPAEIKG